jgi:hypothetical protein
MLKWVAISILAISPAVADFAAGDIFASAVSFPSAIQQRSTAAATSPDPPPSEAEIEARSDELVANQNRNDLAIAQYERVEHQVSRTGGTDPKTIEDRTFRVVPTGTGTMKLLLSDLGKQPDPADYRKQLQLWQQTLELALNPRDSRAKAAYAKFDKKKKDRAELIDGLKLGLTRKWLGRETINGHLCDVIQLDPNPDFHPHTLFQEAISRVTAKIWVDHAQTQLVHGEAHIVRDLSFGGGILGKLYRGGVFSLDQTEVAPGVWLATRYQYDFTARKFLFTFEEHQYIEATHYRHIGPPNEILALVQKELASGKPFTPGP